MPNSGVEGKEAAQYEREAVGMQHNVKSKSQVTEENVSFKTGEGRSPESLLS